MLKYKLIGYTAGLVTLYFTVRMLDNGVDFYGIVAALAITYAVVLYDE